MILASKLPHAINESGDLLLKEKEVFVVVKVSEICFLAMLYYSNLLRQQTSSSLQLVLSFLISLLLILKTSLQKGEKWLPMPCNHI